MTFDPGPSYPNDTHTTFHVIVDDLNSNNYSKREVCRCNLLKHVRWSVYTRTPDEFISNSTVIIFRLANYRFSEISRAGCIEWLRINKPTVYYAKDSLTIEELPYSDYLLETAQYQTNIRFVDLDEHLHPEIEAQVKCLGNRRLNED